MTRQVGNELDEFVTEALRNNLLGLPLDLATLNMARARDTGIPPLNAARRAFFAESRATPALAPYTSWADFGFSLRHPESLVNFIAAYGTHPTITAATAGHDRQARCRAGASLDAAATRHGGHRRRRPRTPTTSSTAIGRLRERRRNGITTTGVDDIDLWVGGLAEKQQVFGGLLGSTFNYVFEKQMEDLQDGDRFYYLSRTAGLNLLTQLEGNSFSELIMRNTDVEGLPADSFSRPDFIFNVANLGTTGADPGRPDDAGRATRRTDLLDPACRDGTVRYGGPEHVVFNGTAPAPTTGSGPSEGDDTIRGNGGNDWLEGGDGDDNHHRRSRRRHPDRPRRSTTRSRAATATTTCRPVRASAATSTRAAAATTSSSAATT